MTLATYKWTIENYHQAIDAGLFADESLELLRGNLVVQPPESAPHAYYNSEISDYLRRMLGDRLFYLGQFEFHKDTIRAI
ncbi:MAG: hypothetical protein WBB82_16360 [Limnothrix sp.]